eukprot:TRINITY_DN4523_c0_g1_i1.p1 TRINITY_DN4523_c0_g1~~TRINITY_DN4523_c0_g1_i1.p1  ORF type:complete len:120 (-),score=18.82 TRINITY_DN4523_c0_g1_i1:151-510(-)
MKDFSRYIGSITKLLEKMRQLKRAIKSEKVEANGVLTEVPEMYFSPDFTLTKPETFKLAYGSSSHLLLQEKLSHYLDIVEVEMGTRISKRSASVFKALSILETLHSEASNACEKLTDIR